MIAAHVNHVQPVCTFLSRTVMLILIFNSTAYCHAHSFILYILYSVLYILFFIHFILCILPLCCILQYLHCPWSGPDSHFTAGYTVIYSYQTCGFHLLDEESGEKLLRLTMNEGPDTYLQTRMCQRLYHISHVGSFDQ